MPFLKVTADRRRKEVKNEDEDKEDKEGDKEAQRWQRKEVATLNKTTQGARRQQQNGKQRKQAPNKKGVSVSEEETKRTERERRGRQKVPALTPHHPTQKYKGRVK